METKLGNELTSEQKEIVAATGHAMKADNTYFFDGLHYRGHKKAYKPAQPLPEYTEEEVLALPEGSAKDMKSGFRIGRTSDTQLPYCLAGKKRQYRIMLLKEIREAYKGDWRQAIAWQLHGCDLITVEELDKLIV